MFSEKLVDIPLEERIFCNRSLNMSSIKAVGFDMDYTLALYKRETFEKLAYTETIKKLILLGYPTCLSSWEFQDKYMVRGLVVDKKRGNILKMDRHRYVKVAYHGFTEIPREERKKLYDVQDLFVYEEPGFALVDTIFALAETFLFAQLVELKKQGQHLQDKTWLEIHQDVRFGIDMCHRDGSIKDLVARQPQHYIRTDLYLPVVLDEIRASGKKIFLLTNSLWQYTHVVMKFLLEAAGQKNKLWTDYFDVIITGSQKPYFFMSKNPLYQVQLESGLLKNQDTVPVIEQTQAHRPPLVFQGGHVKLLHDMLQVQKGSDILYIGDHIYGDILRSKKEIGWRTMLVIEELEAEALKSAALKKQYEANYEVYLQIESLANEMDHLRRAIHAKQTGQPLPSAQLHPLSLADCQMRMERLTNEIAVLKEQEESALLHYHRLFHPIWGELMKTARQNSRFSSQVVNYSCLYTSKVSNLRHYGVQKNFQAVRDFMPHDLLPSWPSDTLLLLPS